MFVNTELLDNVSEFKELGYTIIKTFNKTPLKKNWVNAGGDEIESNTKEAGFVIPPDIVVIDIDPRNFDKGINPVEKLKNDTGVDIVEECNYVVDTANGGMHLYYKKPSDVLLKNEDSINYKGIEFKSKGRQVIMAGSILADGKKYNVSLLKGIGRIDKLSILSAKILDKFKIKHIWNNKGIVGSYTNDKVDIDRVKEILRNSPQAIEGEYGDNTTYKVACLGRDFGLAPSIFFPLLKAWNKKNKPKWSDEELRTKMDNAYYYGKNKLGADTISSIFGEALSKEEKEEIQNKLKYTLKGAIKVDFRNAVLIMNHLEEIKGRLAYNSFSGERVWIKPPKWHLTDGDTGQSSSYKINGVGWSDEDSIQIRYLINDKLDIDFSTRWIEDGATFICQNNPFHPIKNWIYKLPSWDKKDRINNFFSYYFGLENNAYLKECGRLLFISIITRLFETGAKFDYLLIFVGEQGLKKSKLVETLAIHNIWYSSMVGDITSSKETVPMMKGKLLLEWQELSMFSKVDINAIKAFLSTSTDRTREAYRRNAKDYPRQCTIIATTNKNEFLKDETGARRMLPIEVMKEIDEEEIKLNLEQIYAQAYEMYKNKEQPLFLTNREAIRIAQQEQESRFDVDILEDKISSWIMAKPTEIEKASGILDKREIMVKDIFTYCLMKDSTSSDSRPLETRVKSILRRLGYHSTVKTIEGISKRIYYRRKKWAK